MSQRCLTEGFHWGVLPDAIRSGRCCLVSLCVTRAVRCPYYRKQKARLYVCGAQLHVGSLQCLVFAIPSPGWDSGVPGRRVTAHLQHCCHPDPQRDTLGHNPLDTEPTSETRARTELKRWEMPREEAAEASQVRSKEGAGMWHRNALLSRCHEVTRCWVSQPG